MPKDVAQLVSKVNQIAELLGGTADHGDDPNWWRSVVKFDGCKMILSSGDGTKFEVLLLAPDRNLPGCNYYSFDRLWKLLNTTINVSSDKTAQRIVDDIKRRFDFHAIREALEVHTACENATFKLQTDHDTLVHKIASATGMRIRAVKPYQSELYFVGSSFALNIDRLSVSIGGTIDADSSTDFLSVICQISLFANQFEK